MSIKDLATLFNEESLFTAKNPSTFKPVPKFSDKTSAIRRTWAALTPEDKYTETTQPQPSETKDDTKVCYSCQRAIAKRKLTNIADRWYCTDVDECIAHQPKSDKPAATEPVKETQKTKEPKTRGKYPMDAVISVLVKENPKRKGTSSYDRFEAYFSISTVKDALRDGVTPADLNWDVKHNFIKISAA